MQWTHLKSSLEKSQKNLSIQKLIFLHRYVYNCPFPLNNKHAEMTVLHSRSIYNVTDNTSNRGNGRLASKLHRRQGQHRRLCSVSFLMRLFLASTVCVFFLVVTLFYHYYRHIDSGTNAFETQMQHKLDHSGLSPEAYPVYGIQVDFDRNTITEEKNNQVVSAVYAMPSGNHGLIDSPSSPKYLKKTKGIVLLLHACSHNALKFFAPSSTCPDCVGLSEEMRLARIVLERGYIALAVTAGSKNGCWGGSNDIQGIKIVMKGFLNHWLSIPHEDHTNGVTIEIDEHPIVYAIGASSGGYMAAKVVAEGIAESAAVMVMGLRNELLDKISSLPDEPRRKLYLAPMTRDKGTAQRVRDNYAYWTKKHEQWQQLEERKSLTNSTHEIILDEYSCVPLPVTADYLWNRVPGMTLEEAQTVVRVLTDHKHLDSSTLKLIVDPTRSNWRDFFLHEGQDQVFSINEAGSQNENSMVLWGKFDLTPGKSPLAKSLHRAWAMHEYCSEIVEIALDFFEGEKSKQEVVDAIRQRKQNHR